MLQNQITRTTRSVATIARSTRWLAARVALVVGVGVLAFQPIPAHAAQPVVGLGTTASYAVLAGQGVTNTGPTVVNGNLGTFPNPAVTNFPPGIVHGAIHQADAHAQHAKSDLTTAYNDAAGRTPVTTIATQLGGKTLIPGVYNSLSGTFQITGTLTLNASGNPNGVFIFQTASTLVTASSSRVSLIGSASSCNIFWKVGSSATLGTASNFRGNILALASVQVQTGVTVIGRVMARTASVTLDSDVITASTCGASTGGGGSNGGGGSGGGTGGGGTGGGTGGGGTGSGTTGPNQVGRIPVGGVQTGGGSTAGLQGLGLFVMGAAFLVGAAGTLAFRRHVVGTVDRTSASYMKEG